MSRVNTPFRFAVLSVFAAVVCVGYLKTLPNASSDLRADISGASLAPTARGFRVGPLHWDVAYYAHVSALAPFRAYFHEICGEMTGAAAASCIAAHLAASFPHEEPARDMFSRVYDPVADLRAHRAGEPGHCVTRSALLATTMLSAGRPARVVQFVSAAGVGHTVASVWDPPAHRWVVLDPSSGVEVTNDAGPESAPVVASHPGRLRLLGVAPAARGFPRDAADYGWEELIRGTILYPEPWLYTHVGARQVRWPYRAAFAVGGLGQWRIGGAQRGIGVFVQALLAAGLIAAAAGSFRRQRPWATGRGAPLAEDTEVDPLESAGE